MVHPAGHASQTSEGGFVPTKPASQGFEDLHDVPSDEHSNPCQPLATAIDDDD